MSHSRQYQLIVAVTVAALLLIGWTIAYAAMEALPPDLMMVPWMQVLIGVAVAAWGGVTATLGRYLTATYEQRPFHWRAESVKDLFVSVTVGTLVYMAGWMQTWHVATLGAALPLAGFLGVRLLTALGDRFLKQLDKP